MTPVTPSVQIMVVTPMTPAVQAMVVTPVTPTVEVMILTPVTPAVLVMCAVGGLFCVCLSVATQDVITHGGMSGLHLPWGEGNMGGVPPMGATVAHCTFFSLCHRSAPAFSRPITRLFLFCPFLDPFLNPRLLSSEFCMHLYSWGH